MREGWELKSLPDCLEKSPKVTKIPKKHFKSQGTYPIISQEKGLINGYWDDESDVIHVDQPFVIFGDHTQVVKLVDFHFVVGADGVKLLKPKSFLDPRYFYYFLIGNPLKDLGYARHFRLLKELDVAVPPLPEQKRIVAFLDEAFAGIDTAVANTEKNRANARELFESYLSSLFSQRSEGWQVKSVGDFAEHCLGKMLDKQKNKGVMRPYLRNVNVRWFDVHTDDVLEMKIEEHEEDRFAVEAGDLLICEGGYPGRAAIWDRNEPVYFQKALHRVRCNDPRINRWLMYYLYFTDANGELAQHFTGAGIQHFTGKALRAFPVPLPPPTLVEKLLVGVEAVHDEVMALEAIYQQKLTALVELKQSLLQEAFAGELTANLIEREVAEASA